MQESSHLACPSMRWLGVHLEDLERYAVPSSMRIDLTTNDKRKIKRMLERDVSSSDLPISPSLCRSSFLHLFSIFASSFPPHCCMWDGEPVILRLSWYCACAGDTRELLFLILSLCGIPVFQATSASAFWRSQLEGMKRLGKKAEIEALNWWTDPPNLFC